MSASSLHEPPGDPAPGSPRPGTGLLVALALLAMVALGAWLRVDAAFSSDAFTRTDPRGLLRSDPGFLYHVTRSVAEADGLLPEDFRADRRVEYPAVSDLPAMFSVGQELVVAWSWRLLGEGVPLHRWATIVMGIWASLTVVGVYGLARELTGRVGWGLAAAGLWMALAGNYRTIGFVLIREDFALPFLALHLWGLARAWRLRTPASMALCGAALVLAAATWHAMGFFLTIEAAAILAWFLRTGDNPLAVRRAWVLPAVVAAGSLVVPVLFAKGFLLSLPMLVMAALGLAAVVARRGGAGARTPRVAAVVALLLLVPVGAALGPRLFPGAGDYAHVFELLRAKLTHLGRLPDDPAQLSFDARLLWQGPFATAHPLELWGALRLGLVAALAALPVGIAAWWRGAADPRRPLLVAVTLGGLAAAVLIQRTLVLPAMLSPVVAVCLLDRLSDRRVGAAAFALALALQAVEFERWRSSLVQPWYSDPARPGFIELMMEDLGRAVRFIEADVPREEPVWSDFVTGTAVLAWAGNPVLVQPKYETTASRRRIQRFTEAFLLGTTRDFRDLLAEDDCEYVLVNQQFWYGNLHLAGIRPSPTWRPDPRTPFARLCSQDPAVYRELPGFELVFESGDAFRREPGFLRLFRVRAER